MITLIGKEIFGSPSLSAFEYVCACAFLVYPLISLPFLIYYWNKSSYTKDKLSVSFQLPQALRAQQTQATAVNQLQATAVNQPQDTNINQLQATAVNQLQATRINPQFKANNALKTVFQNKLKPDSRSELKLGKNDVLDLKNEHLQEQELKIFNQDQNIISLDKYIVSSKGRNNITFIGHRRKNKPNGKSSVSNKLIGSELTGVTSNEGKDYEDLRAAAKKIALSSISSAQLRAAALDFLIASSGSGTPYKQKNVSCEFLNDFENLASCL